MRVLGVILLGASTLGVLTVAGIQLQHKHAATGIGLVALGVGLMLLTFDRLDRL